MELSEETRDERYCYLTTNGRVTARRHIAELWFVPTEGGVFLMSGSGGLTQWCLNLQVEEQGVLRVGSEQWLARASFLRKDDPDRAAALAAFHEKYDPPGKDRLPPWQRDAAVAQLAFVRRAG